MKLYSKFKVLKKETVVGCWSMNNGFYESIVYTWVYEIRILWFSYFKIIQCLPLIKPYYDGEYASNENAKRVAKEDRMKCRDYILTYKKHS